MSAVVAAIQFNHDPRAKGRSALNLRQNAGAGVALPEWVRGEDAPRESPVAYSLADTRGQALEIRVRLARTDPSLAQAEVRAVQPPGPAPQWQGPVPDDPDLHWPYPEALSPQQLGVYHAMENARREWRAYTVAAGGALGPVAPRVVRFGPDGRTAMEPFALPAPRLGVLGVGAYDVQWQWQMRAAPGEAWRDLNVTRHRVYAVLSIPTAPWTQLPFAAGNVQLPWVDVLDFACAWADGAVNRATAARRVTRAVFSLGNGRVQYDCRNGGNEAYTSTVLNRFDCSGFVELLRGGAGNGPFVNCTDCATMVSTFANALGCDLWQARMGMYSPPFLVRSVLAIGGQRWEPPCGRPVGFTFHEVAWDGACTSADRVWDACLLVDGASAPGAPVPLLPAALRFGLAGQGGYRDLLATFAGRPLCEPRPLERRRRQVM